MSYKDTEVMEERKVVYVSCPLCGRNRVLEVRSERALAKGKGRLRWDFFDPGSGLLIQIREAGGKLPKEEQPTDEARKGRGQAKAAGFPLKQGLSIQEARKGEFADQVEAIKVQVQRLNDFFQSL
ncbi:hypothetical protein ES708_19935 [subsurface metagenome]